MKKTLLALVLPIALAMAGCRSHYEVSEITRSRILIDSRYDTQDTEAHKFLAPYTHRFGEHPDFAVYNMGGIRASLAKGKVTIGDVVDVAPFDNKLCLLTLTGAQVTQLFEQIAAVGGEGVSHEVALVISSDHKLVSATVGGKPIDPNASYRIATLDYLAQGNDKLDAFKQKTQLVSPQTEENNVRYIIMDYFRTHGTVDAAIEGRIRVQ